MRDEGLGARAEESMLVSQPSPLIPNP
jgi:hypothetical protein